MIKTILAVILIPFASSAYAFDLPTINCADIITGTEDLAVPAAEREVSAYKVAANKQYKSLWLSVYLNESWKEAEASDFSAGIDVSVRKTYDNRFNVTTRLDTHSDWDSITKFNGDFTLFSARTNLRMNEWSGNYNISGSITEDNNRTTFLHITLFKGLDKYSFNVTGSGLNMTINRHNISGSYDDARYSKKAVAAVISLVLTAQVDKMPASR